MDASCVVVYSIVKLVKVVSVEFGVASGRMAVSQDIVLEPTGYYLLRPS